MLIPYAIPTLPLVETIETTIVLKYTIAAHKALAELKGILHTIPNQDILINTLALQESKESAAIEHIVTTHDELFQYSTKEASHFSHATKEVQHYASAIYFAFQKVKTVKIISNNLIVDIANIVTQTEARWRNIPGTTLQGETGDIVYTPPQNPSDIEKYMTNLEAYINNTSLSTVDPLIKMAIIHHQFESIHPLFDGNGRTGRILCVLYLVLENLLDLPVLYISRYINKHKSRYYALLQKVRDEHTWEEWIIFILQAVENTAYDTARTVEKIKNLMMEYKSILKDQAPQIYSHECINTIFAHPYTKIAHLAKALGVTRHTASRYLQKMVEVGILTLHQQGTSKYYVNTRLLTILTTLS